MSNMAILSASYRTGHVNHPIDARRALPKTHGAAPLAMQSIRHFLHDSTFFDRRNREKHTKIITDSGVFII